MLLEPFEQKEWVAITEGQDEAAPAQNDQSNIQLNLQSTLLEQLLTKRRKTLKLGKIF